LGLCLAAEAIAQQSFFCFSVGIDLYLHEQEKGHDAQQMDDEPVCSVAVAYEFEHRIFCGQGAVEV
jgi:hypothetical protein